MSLEAKIKAAVETAFSSLGDLVKTVTLNAKSVSGFDHTTQSPIETPVSVTTEAVVTNRSLTENGQPQITLVIKSEGVPEDKYLSIVVDSETFQITSFENNGFSIDSTAIKER